MIKKIFFLIASIFLFHISIARAQGTNTQETGFKIGIALEPGIPVGEIHNSFHFAIGAKGLLEYYLNRSVAFTLSSGFTKFIASTQTISFYAPSGSVFTTTVKFFDFGVVPIQAGFKGFITPHFYVGFEGGPAIQVNSAGNITQLVLSPSLGFATRSGLDIGVKYDHYSNTNSNYGLTAIRLAYNFKI